MKLEFEFGNISHKIQFGNCNIMKHAMAIELVEDEYYD